jgi:hypothetical protein
LIFRLVSEKKKGYICHPVIPHEQINFIKHGTEIMTLEITLTPRFRALQTWSFEEVSNNVI